MLSSRSYEELPDFTWEYNLTSPLELKSFQAEGQQVQDVLGRKRASAKKTALPLSCEIIESNLIFLFIYFLFQVLY